MRKSSLSPAPKRDKGTGELQPRDGGKMRFSIVTDAFSFLSTFACYSFSDMSRMSSSFLSQGEQVIGQAQDIGCESGLLGSFFARDRGSSVFLHPVI